MTDSVLSKEQVSALLNKLGSDDAFRALFESKPAAALQQLGVSAETIRHLSAKCHGPCKLAEKNRFQDASKSIDDKSFLDYTTMEVPQMAIRP
jgi:putative modified peptide